MDQVVRLVKFERINNYGDAYINPDHVAWIGSSIKDITTIHLKSSQHNYIDVAMPIKQVVDMLTH